MNKPCLSILVILLLFFLLWLALCQGSKSHIVTSGNLKFLGDQIGQTNSGGDGLGFSQCIELDHFTTDGHSIDISTTFLLEVDCPSGPSQSQDHIQLLSKFFIEGFQSNYIYLWEVYNTTSGGMVNSGNFANNIEVPYSAFTSNGTKCSASIKIFIIVPLLAISNGIINYGDELDLVVQITEDPESFLHDHTKVYPNCGLPSITGDQETANIANNSPNVPNSSTNTINSNNQNQLSVVACPSSLTDDLLEYYTCLDISQCHPMDHVAIINLPNVCTATNGF